MGHDVTPMTLREVEQSKDRSVFVINMSKSSFPTQIIMKYQTPGGDYESLVVPPTWIPIDLAEFAPKKFLMDSPSLRKTANEGKIIFISEAEALEILKTPEAQKELKKIGDIKKAIGEATRNTIIQQPTGSVILDPVLQNAGKESESASFAQSEADESYNQAINIVANLLSSEDEEEALTSIRNIRSFSVKSLEFMASEIPNKYLTIHEWIANNLTSARNRVAATENNKVRIGN